MFDFIVVLWHFSVQSAICKSFVMSVFISYEPYCGASMDLFTWMMCKRYVFHLVWETPVIDHWCSETCDYCLFFIEWNNQPLVIFRYLHSSKHLYVCVYSVSLLSVEISWLSSPLSSHVCCRHTSTWQLGSSKHLCPDTTFSKPLFTLMSFSGYQPRPILSLSCHNFLWLK